MRRSFRSEILKDDNGQVIGINLGADYCAEHEGGIESLERALGIQKKEGDFGIEARRVSIQPNSHYQTIFLDNPTIKDPSLLMMGLQRSELPQKRNALFLFSETCGGQYLLLNPSPAN